MKKIYKLAILFMALVISIHVRAQDYRKMIHDPNANFYDIQKMFYEYWESKGEDTTTEAQEEDGEYARFKRWEKHMGPRVYPSGKMINPAARAFEAWQNEQKARGKSSDLNLSSEFPDLNGNWISVGPTTYIEGNGVIDGRTGGIGRINCIAIESSNANNIYCGATEGGLWKTTVGGNSWVSLTDGIPDIGVSGIALNRNNENEIYILTGDASDEIGQNQPGIGVLKSENGGATWLATDLTFSSHDSLLYGQKLMMDPINSNVLFAITDNGIYKTKNGGVTWPLILPGGFLDCEFKPDDNNIMYACTRTQFFRSTDNGDSWTPNTTSGFIMNPCPTAPPDDINSRIAVSALNSMYVYLLFDCGGLISLGTSTDAGLTFTAMPESVNYLASQSAMSSNDLTFEVDPNYLSYLYVGGLNLMKSTNGGKSWNQLSDWLRHSLTYVHADQRALVVNGNSIYAGCDGGIFVSTGGGTNLGSTFTDISAGMAIMQISGLGGTPQNSNLYYLGAQDNGTNCLNLSTNINTHIVGGDGGHTVVDYTNSNIVYAQAGGLLYRTSDGGSSWSPLNSMSNPLGGGGTMIMSPVAPQTLYTANTSFYQTTNSGSNWTKLYDFTGQQTATAMGTDNPSHIYSAESTIFRESYDAGNSWTDVTGTLPVGSATISCIAVSTINSNNVWVGMFDYSNGLQVYKSTGGGVFWTPISGTLPPLPIYCLAIVPGSPINALYAGTDIGVYYTDDNLGYWIPFRNGLPNVSVRDLYINVNANTIAAGTFGRGLWVSDLYSSCPSDFNLAQGNNLGSGGYQRYTSGNSIQSDIQYLGGYGTDIKYNAASYIDLQPGFWFSGTAGAIFDGYINGCPAQPAGSHPVSGTLRDDSNLFATSISLLSDSSDNNIQIIPNPFNSSFEISFNLDQDVKTHIDIFNLIGVKIKEAPEQNLLKGNNRLSFDCSDLATGVYLVEITCGVTKVVKKIIKD